MQVWMVPLAVLVLSSAVMCCWYAAVALAFFRRRGPRSAAAKPPVSILIPVRGIDGDAPETWLSFCRQEYPEYEVLFGVQQQDDPAWPLLTEVVHRYPTRARLIHCAEVLGINHQVSNLVQLRRAARHPLIVIADSDIRVGPDYLARVTAPLQDDRVGMVTCGYLCRRPRGLGSAVASLGRCGDFIPQVLIARQLWRGLNFALGPTMATRAAVLEQTDGLNEVLNRIGSDFHLGRLTAEAGYYVEFSDYVLENDGGRETLADVWRREVRWARTKRVNKGWLYYTLFFSGGSFYACLALALGGLAGTPWLAAMGAAGILVRWVQLCLCAGRMEAPDLVRWSLALPLRDGLTLAVWAVGTVGRRIYWRGRRLRLGSGGRLEPDLAAAGLHPTEADPAGRPGEGPAGGSLQAGS